MYYKRINIWPKTLKSIHDQLKKRKTEYPFLDIKDSLRKWDIDYSCYYTEKRRNKFSIATLKGLNQIGIILPDSILQIIYPKSQSSI